MINITDDALNKIKSVLNNNPDKFPRIVLKKGGCAGNMLVLTLDYIHDNDTMVESNHIKFAVDTLAKPHINDITIYTNSILGTNILIKNNKSPSCRCGKSFRI
ncbi:MAG: iron-sulfur cluster assembly accessory protein [Alphaproteobacteria bacterium]|nr:iron-sulfur cluster assembly accessory protein [Alphaproteobacteria bacterium]